MPPATSEYWFIFQDNSLLFMKDKTSVPLPDSSILPQLKPHFIRQQKIGLINNTQYYCAEIKAQTIFPDIEVLPLRQALDVLGMDWYTLISKAVSIMNWDRNHQFCGHCGESTRLSANKYERVCPACSATFYPRISPSVIVLITKGDEILLSRSPHFKPGVYGLIAGFVEVGESLEDTIHREVMEEVSIRVKNLRYFGSQSWPFPDSLMVGFFADYDSGDLKIDNEEIIEAGWYRYDNLPGGPGTRVSIARKMIDFYVNQKTGKS